MTRAIQFQGTDARIIALGVVSTGESDAKGNLIYGLKTAGIATEVAPTAQASTNAYVSITNSKIDTLGYSSLSYTIKNTGADSITWQVLGGNVLDLSDGVVVNGPSTLAAGVSASYAVAPAPYRYYIVQVKSTVADTPGQATVHGIAKG